MMAALEETGQRKNTLVIFTSDQGLAFGQHGFRGVKVAGYDANVRSPLLFSMPGRIPEGEVCDVPVSGVDIPATIFKFTGISPPWEIHGHDLTPLLKNPKANWPHTTMMMATGQKFGADILPGLDGKSAMHNEVPWYILIREKNLKYIRPLITDLEELYDLDTDPEELNNLAVQPAQQQTLRRLRAKAVAELKRTKAGITDHLPPIREAVKA